MGDLLERAQAWVAQVHPHVRHLERTHDWLLALDPDATEATRIAAAIHDIERAYPVPESDRWDTARDWASPAYNRWHQDRCADIAATWLRDQGADDGLVSQVEAIVRAHEDGGWREADLVQAADSLSFLETMVPLLLRWAERGYADNAAAKLQHSVDRIAPYLDRARKLGAPLLDAALAELGRARDRVDARTPGGSLMRALVVRQPNAFSVEDVPRPAPGPYEVLCRVRAAAICGTDPHIIQGHYPGFWPKQWPLVPGHEWCGDVVAMGEGAATLGWEVGTRVAGTSHAPCGYCRKCVEGRYNLCENFGVEGLHRQYGHNTDGAYADYVVHSVRSVFRVPDSLSDEEAAMIDPTAIALHTVKRSRLQPGDTAVVVGPGVMGLLVAECARALGAGRTIVVGRGDRLARAAELAHETVDFTSQDPVQAVRDMTGGLGAEVAMECSGAPEAVGQCARLLRRGGRVAVIGIPLKDAEIPLQRIVLDEIEIVGVRAAAGEMPQAIALVAAGRIRLKELITHRFALEDFADAYRTFTERGGGALKVIVRP